MSPQAVSRRLAIVDELRELCRDLMTAVPVENAAVSGETDDGTDSRKQGMQP